tara:strand:- start:2065 stop:2391 length:327 start_codon:yes stop_codon:yes gene_type:complete
MTKEEFLKAFDSKDRDFEMFSKAGNKKAQTITRQLIKKVFGSKRITKEELLELAGQKLAKAYKDERYSEILDTEPPYHIKHYVKKALGFVGYDFGDIDIESRVWDYTK